MKKENNYKIVVLLIAFTVFVSCRKFVDVGEPRDKVVSERVFADSANATSAISGIYISWAGGPNGITARNGGISIYSGLSSDELTYTDPETDLLTFYSNSLNSSNSISWGSWNAYYNSIYSTNAIIEGLAVSNIGQSLKNQLSGEAKFWRALSYFYLVNFFGDVPLVTTTDFKTNANLARTPKELVYQQIVKDLVEAKDQLKPIYPSSGRFRVNSFAAKALLARVYLYLGQWGNAEALSSEVINNSSVYVLESDLNNVFLSSSRETILQIMPVASPFATPEGIAFVPSSTTIIPTYFISDILYSNFEANDNRKTKWIGTNRVTVSGVPKDYYYPFKLKLRTSSSTAPAESTIYLRLAEQFLIRAEARAQQNLISLGNADLNMIRNRAGLGNISLTTKEELITAILKERRHELFCEWGHRWLDLKRTGLINSYMPGITTVKGGTWSPNWQLWPIPIYEIQANPFLVQNLGY